MRFAVPGSRVELIDTCWDVNIDNIAEALASIPGINRYMLGCKCIPDLLGIDIANGINRYMLGCKCLESVLMSDNALSN